MVKKLFRQFKYGQKGFTLIELLVVVAILGVLAAVAIPNVAKFIGSGQKEAAKTELSNVQTAVTAYMAYWSLAEIPADLVTSGIVPGGSAWLDSFLTQDVQYKYVVTEDGTVSPDPSDTTWPVD